MRAAAARLEWSEAKIWRIETGQTSLRSFDVETMCRVYGGLATVSIRVMPFGAGLHHGIMSGPFEILQFPLNGTGQDTEPPTVYVESFAGALYLDKPREVDRYDTAFTNIWVSALDERASQELITQVARELGK